MNLTKDSFNSVKCMIVCLSIVLKKTGDDDNY